MAPGTHLLEPTCPPEPSSWSQPGPQPHHFKPTRSKLGGLGPILVPSLRVCGPCWRQLGAMLAHLGPMLAHLGPMLAHLGPILALSWPILVLCWLARPTTWTQDGPKNQHAQLGFDFEAPDPQKCYKIKSFQSFRKFSTY